MYVAALHRQGVLMSVLAWRGRLRLPRSRMRLRRFREHLQSLLGTEEPMRPFVCDGSPYDCTAFVVGINPASSMPFWPFWNDETGFDRAAWLESYRDHRKAEPLKLNRVRRQPISSTRQRIEWIAEVASPVKILETNLYALPTRKAADLGRADRATEPFEFLVAEISPSVILLHGAEVQREFARLYRPEATNEFSAAVIKGKRMMVAAVPHLSRASRGRANELAKRIRCIFTEL
jgi:hypothetical protein